MKEAISKLIAIINTMPWTEVANTYEEAVIEDGVIIDIKLKGDKHGGK